MEDIAYMADWANSLCRKILGYRTPERLFEAEMDRIYALWRPRRAWFFERVPPLPPEEPDATAGIVTTQNCCTCYCNSHTNNKIFMK